MPEFVALWPRMRSWIRPMFWRMEPSALGASMREGSDDDVLVSTFRASAGSSRCTNRRGDREEDRGSLR